MRVVLFILSLFALPVTAEIRCDTELVTRGATHHEVRERCGVPLSEFSFIDYRYPGYAVYVDEWLYDMGRNRFRRLLQFENGRLVRVDVRDKPGRIRRSRGE
ncbi:MAG: DUF2845 domain-containing protein [Pseudomonadales bacterium]|jgi:hypothetical protein|nr:DUF2845 domain-containing protein [Pseudomonadales bacterium]MDP6472479.1 DUF2845 domain-containing protein [Pseudomonadales bacterium]MDP6828710.1 DUF2845 domain-containing protein [Pseudomonadales bacterium]MDP6973309.1 DUF2845 domain-containing protein [Pseudomonadales bacterium]|tara:strand:+ start:354 stop:659 length:306 start_codon:yes stop_codon:yes gene_type:complete